MPSAIAPGATGASISSHGHLSATKLIVEAMGKTVVEGDTTFLKGLDPEHVAKDLVDYRFVEAALKNEPAWVLDASVDRASPFVRSEVLEI